MPPVVDQSSGYNGTDYKHTFPTKWNRVKMAKKNNTIEIPYTYFSYKSQNENLKKKDEELWSVVLVAATARSRRLGAMQSRLFALDAFSVTFPPYVDAKISKHTHTHHTQRYFQSGYDCLNAVQCATIDFVLYMGFR